MPEICTAEQADFSQAWQQNGTAKVAAFLSPQELGELRTAVGASYDLLLPSLVLIPGSNKTMRITPSREGKEEARPDDWVKANVPGESWVPHAMPGDAILFDHWTLHRTQRMEQDNAVRTSCEFRFVRTS